MDARRLAVGMLLFTAACPRPHGAQLGGGDPATARDAGAGRRAWIGWRSHEPLVRACGSGASDPIPDVGQANCWRGGAGGPLKMTDNGFVRDASPADHVPGDRCRVEYEDAADASSPARAWLASPTGRELLDAWMPAAGSQDTGYATEVSFSPDGKLVALVHLRVTKRASGAFIEVDEVLVRRAPACP
ncbi:MAG: hypothetical protein KF764_28025 [Labilithrix sp.]|nr:hypothetical protein [Labilithrix sp.]